MGSHGKWMADDGQWLMTVLCSCVYFRMQEEFRSKIEPAADGCAGV
ncbi:hypothetical protein ACFLS1_01750 [Verrucomicrobiota bacterium]